MASEVKNAFLSRIMQLPIECKEVFMTMITNGLAMVPNEDKPPVSSPSRARTLLERIDEL
jgi:hypothetical protein